MSTQDEHIDLLKLIATGKPGTQILSEAATIKISASDSIEAGRRLEEVNEFNFAKRSDEKQAQYLIGLRDSIIDLHYRHFSKSENLLISEGGSRSGKTNNMLRYAILQNVVRKWDLNIIAPSYKMLNLGSFIDAKEFVEKYDIECRFPASASGQIKFKSGGTITFEVVTSENEAKRNRDNVFMNEVDGVKEAIADLVIGRAKGKTFIDYNPVKKFWSEKYKTPSNTLLTTWRDNPFLSQSQLEWFDRLEKNGKNAEPGSPERYAYDVYFLGQYSLLSGKAYQIEDFDIVDEVPASFDYYISYSDPSLGEGGDFFASLFVGIKKDKAWALDCIFSQFTKTGGFIEKLKEWDRLSKDQCDHYAEKNGMSGVVTKAVKDLYDGTIHEVSNMDNKHADIIVYAPFSKRMKFKRSNQMVQFLEQCADYPNAANDDAPDCLSRSAKIINKYLVN